jgi:hypothetical protein
MDDLSHAITPAPVVGFPDPSLSIKAQLQQIADALLHVEAQHGEIPSVEQLQTAIDEQLKIRDARILRLEGQIGAFGDQINAIHAIIG